MISHASETGLLSLRSADADPAYSSVATASTAVQSTPNGSGSEDGGDQPGRQTSTPLNGNGEELPVSTTMKVKIMSVT